MSDLYFKTCFSSSVYDEKFRTEKQKGGMYTTSSPGLLLSRQLNVEREDALGTRLMYILSDMVFHPQDTSMKTKRVSGKSVLIRGKG